VKDYTLIVMLE